MVVYVVTARKGHDYKVVQVFANLDDAYKYIEWTRLENWRVSIHRVK